MSIDREKAKVDQLKAMTNSINLMTKRLVLEFEGIRHATSRLADNLALLVDKFPDPEFSDDDFDIQDDSTPEDTQVVVHYNPQKSDGRTLCQLDIVENELVTTVINDRTTCSGCKAVINWTHRTMFTEE